MAQPEGAPPPKGAVPPPRQVGGGTLWAGGSSPAPSRHGPRGMGAVRDPWRGGG